MTAGAAQAQPVSLTGTQGAVGYTTALADRGTVETVLDGGSFALRAGADTVEIVDGSGTTIGTVPLTYRVADKQFPITAAIVDNGRKLTLTPDTNPLHAIQVSQLPVRDINSQQRSIDELNKASFGGMVGAGVGAGIGLLVGCVVGVFVGCIPGVLIGAAAGGVIGLANTGGQPMLQAAFDYFTGQP
ncbi:hypothetical protein [Nocardia abscessus]|uniref:hypothetical protein n=1 Tax=Nocardia abscessus TaxID=120957 RepID=UPI001E5C4547|nr:hypothetical protein [Nocardia abscessus]